MRAGLKEPFYFGIPLIARAAARDWQLIDRLLEGTLKSLLAQTDRQFTILLAGHDAPDSWHRAAAGDERFHFIEADWRAERPSAANDDGGMKKWRIKERVRALDGGLLMFVDADDWVGKDLVSDARAKISPNHVGAVITRGYALDQCTGRALPFPLPGYPGGFDCLCGSSTVARVAGEAGPELLNHPYSVLGSHHEWREVAAAKGLKLSDLDAEGVYVIGTSQNHSESDGPFAAWRQGITEAVRKQGRQLPHELLATFGQTLELEPAS